MARISKKRPRLKNWKKGLTIFGILEILMGFTLLWLGTKLVDIDYFLPVTTFNLSAFFGLAFVLIAILGGYWIILGFGSTLAQRWSRALGLVSSWLWLIFGIFLMIGAFGDIFFPKSNDTNSHPELYFHFLWIFILVIFIGGICFPLALILFYGNPRVKAVCELENPQKSWTDKCPLPLFPYILTETAFIIFNIIVMPFIHFTILFLGIVFSGFLGALVIGTYSFIKAYFIWGFYRQRIKVWWTALIFYLILIIGTPFFYSSDNRVEYLRDMGFSDSMVNLIQKDHSQDYHYWMIGINLAVILGYFLFVKKYFLIAQPKHGKKIHRHNN
jgi:hypothetical protein